MSTTDVAYLRKLDDELRDLPRARREEILAPGVRGEAPISSR